MKLSFIYPKCQVCTQKTRCDFCGDALAKSICKIDGIQECSVNMTMKSLELTSTLDPDDIEMYLEDLGVFAN